MCAPGRSGGGICSLQGPGRGGEVPVWIQPPLEPAGLHPPAHWTVVSWKRLRWVRSALFLLPSWRHVDPPRDPRTQTSLLPWGMSCCTAWPLRWSPTLQRPPSSPSLLKGCICGCSPGLGTFGLLGSVSGRLGCLAGETLPPCDLGLEAPEPVPGLRCPSNFLLSPPLLFSPPPLPPLHPHSTPLRRV